MAGISDIVTRGYGSWGSVNDLPTLGFGIGEAAAVTAGMFMEKGAVWSIAWTEQGTVYSIAETVEGAVWPTVLTEQGTAWS